MHAATQEQMLPTSEWMVPCVCAGLPISSAEDDRSLDFETYSRTTSASAAQPRLKGESSEEKKQRKAAVKEAKV